MLRFERLEQLGLQPAYFRLPTRLDELATLDYYLLVDVPDASIRRKDRWEILAVGTLASNPFDLVIKQLHIEREALEWPPFDGWTDSSGLQSFTPAGVSALRKIVISLSDQLPTTSAQVGPHTYFVPATTAEYRACGLPQGLLERDSFRFREHDVYRYQPDAAIGPCDDCYFLRISKWMPSTHSESSKLSLEFERYTVDRVAKIQQDWVKYIENQAISPLLDIAMMDAESMLHLSRGALAALASLLWERLSSVSPLGTA